MTCYNITLSKLFGILLENDKWCIEFLLAALKFWIGYHLMTEKSYSLSFINSPQVLFTSPPPPSFNSALGVLMKDEMDFWAIYLCPRKILYDYSEKIGFDQSTFLETANSNSYSGLYREYINYFPPLVPKSEEFNEFERNVVFNKNW